MALTKTITSPHGFECLNCYIRIEELNFVGNIKTKMHFVICYYKDITSSAFHNAYFTCPYDINGDNPIKQAYMHLKTLPEFADAVDC